MNGFSEKIYLSLKMPTEEVPVSDQKRILLALETLGYENVTMPLSVLRMLYPCAGMRISISPLRWFTGKRIGR